MIIILVFALLFLMISGAFSSCSAVVQGGTSSLLGTSFTATDEDITGTNEDYKALEAALKMRSTISNLRIPVMMNTDISWMRSTTILMS